MKLIFRFKCQEAVQNRVQELANDATDAQHLSTKIPKRRTSKLCFSYINVWTISFRKIENVSSSKEACEILEKGCAVDHTFVLEHED
ncbi:hypothetical protein QL285_016130 [Trifolium repens]|jgi:hypothetical protein|nr:hypothetical protein QL285_016130 [Trifolium repens]